MYKVNNGVPSSLRQPPENSRFAQNLLSKARRPTMIAAGSARAAALSKSRFARLPQEGEDAKLTGTTRSLQRRLLALNLAGTLIKPASMILKTRTA